MQTIRGRRQSSDPAASEPSTFRTSASNSWCADSSQDRYETACDSTPLSEPFLNSITTGLPFSSSPSVSIRPRCHGPVGYSDAKNRMPSIASRPASTRRCSSTSSATVEPGSSTSRPPASRRNNISSAIAISLP